MRILTWYEFPHHYLSRETLRMEALDVESGKGGGEGTELTLIGRRNNTQQPQVCLATHGEKRTASSVAEDRLHMVCQISRGYARRK